MSDEPQDMDQDQSLDKEFTVRPAPRIHFESIAQGSREVAIEYQGQIYRLRVTRNGKLILNK